MRHPWGKTSPGWSYKRANFGSFLHIDRAAEVGRDPLDPGWAAPGKPRSQASKLNLVSCGLHFQCGAMGDGGFVTWIHGSHVGSEGWGSGWIPWGIFSWGKKKGIGSKSHFCFTQQILNCFFWVSIKDFQSPFFFFGRAKWEFRLENSKSLSWDPLFSLGTWTPSWEDDQAHGFGAALWEHASRRRKVGLNPLKWEKKARTRTFKIGFIYGMWWELFCPVYQAGVKTASSFFLGCSFRI